MSEQTMQQLEELRQVEDIKELQEGARRLFKRYQAAMSEVQVRLQILNDDLEFRLNRNPIHHFESRLKKPASAFEKLQRYGLPLTLESLEQNLYDIAGIRVICSYTDDVYKIVNMISLQDDMEIIKVKDYISHPKPNGYRSLHIVVKVPVYFMDVKESVPVEIQFRTIAMDLWASLEHSLKYKQAKQLTGIDMVDELKNCSDIIEDVETRMQILLRAIETNNGGEEDAAWLRAHLEEIKEDVARRQQENQ